jgi:hypothetical protein
LCHREIKTRNRHVGRTHALSEFIYKICTAVVRDSLLLLLPPCFYIAKWNKRECYCIWLSGPGFQDLDKRTLGLFATLFVCCCRRVFT